MEILVVGLLILVPALVVGLFLYAVSALVVSFWDGRESRPLRAVRWGLVAVYAGIGAWVYRFLGFEYARELAEVSPDGGCSGWGEDNSGCVPTDFRRGWVILWCAAGLVALIAFVVARRRATIATVGDWMLPAR